MQRAIPFQRNDGGLVALLPDGRVEFLHAQAEEALKAYNAGDRAEGEMNFNRFVLNNPLVQLDKFHLSAPAITFVEITNLCNLACKHCYAWSGPRRDNEMSTETILSLLDELADIGSIQVFLTGGEVFAHKDALTIINHARSKPFSTQIFTNGTLITEAKLAQIPRGQSFFISFDTAQPERTIRGKMDFPKLRDIYGWMQRHGHVLRTAISVHRGNVDEVEEIFEWCAENGFPRPQWLETHPIGRALINPHILLRPDQVDAVFEVYQRCMDRYQHASEVEAENTDQGSGAGTMDQPSENQVQGVQTIKFCQRLEHATGQEKCGRSVAYVSSQGYVYPCSNCMSNGMYRAGNVMDQRFCEIWESGFEDFRKITFAAFDDCKGCAVQRDGIWCQFRCPPLAMNVSRSETSCGATEYLQQFMVMSNRYWRAREREGFKLRLEAAPRAQSSATITATTL